MERKSKMVEPLKSRTMTLGELQMATLSVLSLVRKQLRRNPAKGGMSDEEFIENILEPLETDIRQDRHVLRDTAKRK
jgi:hypothetical protein